MGTVYGTNATIVNAAGPPGSFVNAGKWGGKVRVMTDTYEAASLAAGSVIRVAQIPKDAIVLGLSNYQTDDLGTSTMSIKVGVSANDDLFDGYTAQTTARKWLDAIGGIHWKASDDVWVIMTTAVAVATGTIKSEIVYAVE